MLTKDRNRRVSHVWLRYDVLFVSARTEGAEQLSDKGKAELDAALTPNLARLVDSIVVVEGYSDQGSPADRYVHSRTRAALVRDYLIERFDLDPAPLGRCRSVETQVAVETGTWNGVALAVFI